MIRNEPEQGGSTRNRRNERKVDAEVDSPPSDVDSTKNKERLITSRKRIASRKCDKKSNKETRNRNDIQPYHARTV